MKNISVIGSGTMGNGIAHTFAQNGYAVALIDINPEALARALATIAKNLDRMVSKGSISDEIKVQTLANITTYTSLAEGVKTADLIIEAATENPTIKKKIFRKARRKKMTEEQSLEDIENNLRKQLFSLK